MANRPYWGVLDGNELEKRLGFKKFTIFNDFVYTSYAIVKIDETELTHLNDVKRTEGKPKVVCGVGTGLGICYVVPI